MVEREWVVEVEDGEKKTHKLSKSDDQRYIERGTLGCEDEDSTDTDVLSETVS